VGQPVCAARCCDACALQPQWRGDGAPGTGGARRATSLRNHAGCAPAERGYSCPMDVFVQRRRFQIGGVSTQVRDSGMLQCIVGPMSACAVRSVSLGCAQESCLHCAGVEDGAGDGEEGLVAEISHPRAAVRALAFCDTGAESSTWLTCATSGGLIMLARVRHAPESANA
jgi:hypothetical protein